MQKRGTSDTDFNLNEQLRKVIVGGLFIAMLPLLLFTTIGVDLVGQGCIVYTADDVTNEVKKPVGDGFETVTDADVGECKEVVTKNTFVTNLYADIRTHVPMAVGLIFLAIGVGIALGPGISILKYRIA